MKYSKIPMNFFYDLNKIIQNLINFSVWSHVNNLKKAIQYCIKLQIW